MGNPNRSFKGLADVYVKRYNTNAIARAVGSLSQVDLTHQVQNLQDQNFGRQGGLMNSMERLQSVGLAITFQSISLDNLALALRSEVTSVSASSVTDEPHKAFKGGLIRTKYMNPSAAEVTNAAGTTTYVEGEDYKVTGAGIVPLESGDITDNQDVLLSYTFEAQRVVEPFTTGQGEYTLYFDGLNEAENNTNVAVDLWRVKLNIPQTLSMIGDNYMRMATTGSLLLDSTVPPGKSPFYRWNYPGAA